MSLRNQITDFRGAILQRVGDAARSGSSKNVVGGSRLLLEIDELLESYDAVARRFKNIRSQMNDGDFVEEGLGIQTGEPGKKPGKKILGEQRRRKFLSDAESRGKPMLKIRGVRYSSRRRRCIGIATASESPERPNRWFLGLPTDKYDGFVLLCEDHEGRVHRFIADSDIAREILPRLSKDGVGQIKFHVTREGSRFNLDVPGSARRSINAIRDRFENL